MGIFHESVQLFNRAPVDLGVIFDGQKMVLKPGINVVPKVVVSFAKNQNPVMGTHNPYDPHVNAGQNLVGVVGSKDNVEPLTAEEWADHLDKPCRENVQTRFEDKYGLDPKARLVSQGKGRKTTASSRYDAGSSPSGNAEYTNKQ
jgi:hypothetical protein